MLPPNLKSLYPGPAPVIHQLGPYSALAFPNYWRRRLAGLRPYFAVAPFSLNPGQAAKLNLTLPPECWIVSFRASVSAPGGLRFQLFDPIRDAALSQRPFDTRCGMGTGLRPLPLTRPLHIRETTPVLIRIANQDLVNPNTGQLVLETYF